MRVYLVLTMFLTAGLGLGCGQEKQESPASSVPAPVARVDSNLLARVHFSGTTQLLADTNMAAKLNEIAGLPETAALRDDAMQKLATAPYRLLQEQKKLPNGASDQAALFRPLLEDLLHDEWYAELDGPTNPVPELLLAINLSDERAALWRTNLSTILAAWTKLPINEIQVEGYSGWELKKHDSPNLVRFIRAGNWVLLGWGDNTIAAAADALQRIKAKGRPVAAAPDYWLDAWADWPRLLADEPVSTSFKLPTMQLMLGLKDDSVGSKVVLTFPEALAVTLPEWKIPTNIIRNQLINFTAARGLAPLLGRIPLLQDLKLDPIPDQLYAWAMFGVPFETCIATPVANGTNFLEQVGSRLISQENSNLLAHGLGQLGWNETRTSLNWTGIPPIVSPYLSAACATNGDFALLGFFPSVPRTAMPPPELFNQVTSKTNLLYYDWEITGERVGQWWNFITLYYILRHQPISAVEAPAQKWIQAISSKVGNCVTEVTLTAPNELTLLRKSPLGLSSAELANLLHWEDANGFPLNAAYMPHARARQPLTNAPGQPSGVQPPVLPVAPLPVSQPMPVPPAAVPPK
jgi:hypothetical protein